MSVRPVVIFNDRDIRTGASGCKLTQLCCTIILCCCWREHITLVLRELHWLPVRQLI